MKKIRRLIDTRYAKERGLEDGLDPILTDAEVMGFVFDKLAQRSRAVVRGFPRIFLSSGVKIRGRNHLWLGPGVAIGRRVSIDARSREGVRVGAASTIDEFAIVRASGVMRNLGAGVRIGERSAIGLGNFIHGGGGVQIGDDCLLGPYVTLVSENHVFRSAIRPIREQGELRAPIVVENDVWIGGGATILAGVRIGEGAIVAAGAVVNRDVEPFTVVGGVPAKTIGVRGQPSGQHAS